MTNFFARFSVWSLLTAGIASFCAVFGFAGGVIFGKLNTELDFCGDSTSGRYITDQIVHAEVCD